MVASADAAGSSSTALATSAGTALREVRSNVPPGIRITWSQRKETISVDICVPDIEEADVTMEDEGLVELRAKDPRHACTLRLFRRIHTADSRWWLSGRSVKLELAKAEYGLGHWDKLVAGEKLPNVLIDWSSWIEEAEETEVRATALSFFLRCARSLCAPGPRFRQMRNNPYGHDAKHMASAMGAHWGSNIDRTIKAKQQAQAVDTYTADDPEDDEFSMT